jgi:hypothetical protein
MAVDIADEMMFGDIPVEDTTMVSAGTALQDPNFVGPVQPGGVGAGWIDPNLDSTGDEGYVDSSGSLGGGNSTSSNDPTESAPAPGSPVSSWSSIIKNLEGLGVASATVANAVEGKSTSNKIGRPGQSASVKGSAPSILDRLFGPTTTQSNAGKTSMVAILLIVAVVIGLGYLVYKGVR